VVSTTIHVKKASTDPLIVGFEEMGGSIIAIPGIAEGGYLDTKVTVSTPGGHSSVPPPHTVRFNVFCSTSSDQLFQSIGILSRLLVEYEANPIEAHLERGTPVYSTVQCVGEHAKNFPASLRALIKASAHSDRALHRLEAELVKDSAYKALIGTTQAIDLVQGGVKVNALPEEAWAVVNHRIATQRSVFSIDNNCDSRCLFMSYLRAALLLRCNNGILTS
jgi:Gly-Xaa carboxypeptidase